MRNDRETVFGLGRVETLNRLTQIVVREALASLIERLPAGEGS